MRVDSHQHFWQIARGDYGWLNAADHPKIARDYLPRDLVPVLAAGHIDRTILVQAAPTEAETGFLLELANATPFVAGVVGWIDFDAAGAAERVARLENHPNLVGLRPMIQDIPDAEWMLRSSLAATFAAMRENELCFDALVTPRHLPALVEFLERYEGLSVVIDHGAKPDIAGAGLEVWSTFMRRIARNSRALCKISGLASEAGARWSAEVLKSYVDVLLESFGPSRLMWGSDWPVVNEVGDYAGWLAAAETLTRHLSAAEREQIFGGTAAAFYGIAA
jgi:L-fucono-1,5-lactonase